MPMTDAEKARRLFEKAGLAFPAIPGELAARLQELDEWLFSTRPIETWPYDLQGYVREGGGVAGEYVVVAHSGTASIPGRSSITSCAGACGCFCIWVGAACT